MLYSYYGDTIYDVRYVKEDRDGGKEKKLKKNPDTGVSFQEFGHLSDCMEYVVCEIAKEDYNKFINPNSGKLKSIPRVISRQRY